eukprot:1618600-Pleurochrysis_carterae.AAC.1
MAKEKGERDGSEGAEARRDRTKWLSNRGPNAYESYRRATSRGDVRLVPPESETEQTRAPTQQKRTDKLVPCPRGRPHTSALVVASLLTATAP